MRFLGKKTRAVKNKKIGGTLAQEEADEKWSNGEATEKGEEEMAWL